MRRTAFIIVAGLVATAAALPAPARGDEPNPSPPSTCRSGVPGGVSCIVSRKDLKDAHHAFARGLKLKDHKHLEEAFAQFDEAARLVPQNPQFFAARELVKGQLVFNHVERGNLLMSENSRAPASAEFRAALDLDPENQFARERLAEANREAVPGLPAVLPSPLAASSEIHLEPRGELATVHFRGDIRGLFTELAAAYGVTAQFDDSVPSRQVQFNLDDADFLTALKLACLVSKTMWSALDTRQFLIAADSLENHKQFDRLSLGTFALPPHTTPQEATEIGNTLRVLFDLRFVTIGQTANTLEIRAPGPILDACAQLLAQLDNEPPQVMLDVRVFQISHQLTRNIGVHIPDTFNLYNIPAAALAGLAGQNIGQLINQLISSGGINQAGSSALSGLLAQLQGQQNSIFSQPLATFGGGLTFMGLSLDQFAVALSLNESWARSLENMSMRADQGTDATFHLGERYPILNASYAPIYNSPQIAQVLGNQTYVPPFPSVSYEDLGLNLKAKPTVHRDGSVSLQLDLQVRSLTGDSNNGVPVISNKEYTGSINLSDGEPAVVAGEISRSDQLSMSGIPGLASVPALNQAALNHNKQVEDDELMIVLTPHVLSNIDASTPEIWISQRQ